MEDNDYPRISDRLKISINKLYKDQEVLLQTIEEGLQYQLKENPIVAYQGTEGSFGEAAALDYFKDNINSLSPCEAFEDVLEAVKRGEVDYGVLPIENSSTGPIFDVYDLVRQYNLYIVGEQVIKIRHHLLGCKESELEDITEVYSHPQAINQCKSFLKENKKIVPIAYSNTAVASKMIGEAKKLNKAAIGSERAAALYDLKIVVSDIHTNDNNVTRFIILSKSMEINKKCDKVSIVFTTSHTSGALYNTLSHFVYNGLNLLKIQSRPIENEPWHYFFFVDIEGNLEDANVLIALGNINKQSKYFKVLGNFKRYD